MTNRISKVIQNGTEYIVGGVDSVNGTTGAVTLKTVNNNALDGTGNISIEEGITKVFTLSSTSDLTTAQQAYDWYSSGNNAIIKYNNIHYHRNIYDVFTAVIGNGNVATGIWGNIYRLQFVMSGSTVSNIIAVNNQISIAGSAPTGVNNSQITLVI